MADARVSAPPAAARAALQRALETEPTRFAAFQAVRLLGRLRSDRAPVGGWAEPGSEVVRFSVPPSLAFPPAEVLSIRPPADGEGPHRLSVTFFGLTGPQAVLPHAYTQHAADRARARDTAFRDFLDLFHHRALSLFYRAWGRSKPVLGHETGEDDWLLDHLLDAAGLGTRGLRGRLPIADAALGHYAALLAPAARSADGLARLVGDYFDVPAQVEQFVGEWRRVDGGGQVTLGGDDATARLGLGVVGDEVWDPQARVRLRLGPLTRAQFDAFLPGGAAHPALAALARLYVDDQVGVDAQLVLDRGHVAPCVLGVPLGGPRAPPPPASPAPGDAAPRRPTGPPRSRRPSGLRKTNRGLN
ncbi:type VI secretion system baseplate subunit TssG, partial [Roseisolibacter sp. H3M3-2]|uniref:type VI secretion system baseplate subunit TssG n=1 Tax=Roseisolibacter sp. H3M3-2 TaxID=3031323 RepID=UPI0023DC1132